MNRANKIKFLNKEDVFKITYILSDVSSETFMNYSALTSTLKLEYTYWKHIDMKNNICNGFSNILNGYIEKIEALPDFLADDINENDSPVLYIRNFLNDQSNAFPSYSSKYFVISLNIVNKDYKHVKDIKDVYGRYYENNNELFRKIVEIFNHPNNLYKLMQTSEVGLNAAIIYFGIKNKSLKFEDVNTLIEEDIVNLNEQIKATGENIEIQRNDLQLFNEEYKDELKKWKFEKQAWFDRWDLEKQEWFAEKEKEVLNLENTYAEKLKLSEPVQFWKQEAKKRRNSFIIWMAITIILSVGIFTMGSEFVNKFYEIAIKDSENKSFIPYSLIMVAFVTFVIYLLRMSIKIMMSAKHLQTEYEQKATFTYFYLTLLKEEGIANKLENTDRSFIIQTLFSQIDTGIIKADSSSETERLFMRFISKSN